MKILPNIPKSGLKVNFYHPTFFHPKIRVALILYTLPEVGDKIAIRNPQNDDTYTTFEIIYPRLAIHDITKEDSFTYNFNLKDIVVP